MSEEIAEVYISGEELPMPEVTEPEQAPAPKGCRCGEAKRIRDLIEKARIVQPDINKPE